LEVTNSLNPDFSSFQGQLDKQVLHEIGSGFESLDALLNRLPGLYPTALLDSLRRLESKGRIGKQVLIGITNRTEQNNSSQSEFPYDAPVPHPIDFDWRFDVKTANDLLEISLSLSRADDLVLYLGCPTVFRASTKAALSRKFFLLDKNPVYSREFNSAKNCVCCDLLYDLLPPLQAQVTLADPPWYESYQRAFLESASQSTQLGGFVLITTPSLWTRPNVRKDWKSLVSWSRELGLNFLGTLSGIVRYTTPYFERNSLKAAGLDYVPKNWRQSNLLIFQKTLNIAQEKSLKYHYHDWLEESHFGFRIRKPALQLNRGFKEPSLISIVPGDILPSVSRTDPARSLADVWTEGNRVFACTGPMVLQSILRALDERSSVTKSVEQVTCRSLRPSEWKIVSTTIRKVVSIVDLEKNERQEFERTDA
jgi:hypothetical protein